MFRRPPSSTRTDTLFPYTTLFRSEGVRQQEDPHHGLPPGDAFEHLPVGSPIRGERFRAMRVCCDLALGGHALRHIQSTRFRTMEPNANRSEEHTSELQSLMRISYAVFCLKKKNKTTPHITK